MMNPRENMMTHRDYPFCGGKISEEGLEEGHHKVGCEEEFPDGFAHYV